MSQHAASQPRLQLVEFVAPSDFPVESYSPFCVKVHRALRLAGLRYGSVAMTEPSEIKAINPLCQLPVLMIDGEPLPDSTAIAKWIEAQVPGSLVPDSNAAETWLWEEFADTALNNLCVGSRWMDDDNFAQVRAAFFGHAPLPVRLLVPGQLRKRVLGNLKGRDVGRRGWPAFCARATGILDQLEVRAPETGFWTGSKPSVADAAIFGQLQSLRTPFSPVQRQWVEARGRLTAYLDRFDALTRGQRGEDAVESRAA